MLVVFAFVWFVVSTIRIFSLEVHVGRALPLLELLVERGGGIVFLGLDIHVDGLGVPLRLFVEACRPREVAPFFEPFDLPLEAPKLELLGPGKLFEEAIPVASVLKLLDPFLDGDVDDDDDQQNDSAIYDGRWKEALQEIHVSIVEPGDETPNTRSREGSRGRVSSIVALAPRNVKAARSHKVTGVRGLTGRRPGV